MTDGLKLIFIFKILFFEFSFSSETEEVHSRNIVSHRNNRKYFFDVALHGEKKKEERQK
jgi:hypothetical protein